MEDCSLLFYTREFHCNLLEAEFQLVLRLMKLNGLNKCKKLKPCLEKNSESFLSATHTYKSQLEVYHIRIKLTA